MKKYTVIQIRKKLGSLMKKIYTDEYISIYNSIKIPLNNVAPIITSTIDATNTFIVLIANNLDNPAGIDKLIHDADYGILFSLAFRYHNLSIYFNSIDQFQTFSLRDNDKDFLLDVLIGIFSNDFPEWVLRQ